MALMHLAEFRSVYVTLEFAQGLKLPPDVNEVACRVTVLNETEGKSNVSSCTPLYAAVEPSLPIDRRIALPYAAQRQMEFALIDSKDSVLGSYTLLLSPFSSVRKSLAAKMRLKHPQTLSEVGYLNVKVKLCPDPPPALLPETQMALSLIARYRSLHVCFRNFINVKEHHYFKPDERVYTSVLLSSTSRRTSLRPVDGDVISFDSTLQFPYRGERQFAVALHATERFKADRRLLTFRLDFLSLEITEHAKRLSLPAKVIEPGIAPGILILDVLLSPKVVLVPVKIEGATAFVEAALNSSAHLESQHKALEDVDLSEELEPLQTGVGTLLLVIHHIAFDWKELEKAGDALDLSIKIASIKVEAAATRIEGNAVYYDKAYAFPASLLKRFCLISMQESGHGYAIDLNHFFDCRGNVMEAAGTLMPQKATRSIGGKLFFRLEKRCSRVTELTVVNNWETW